MADAHEPICRSDELTDGGPGVRFDANFSRGEAAVAKPAFVIRFRGRPFAYLNRCGHVPVELDWNHGDFFDYSGQYLICSTHGALYGPESGLCLGGRCAGHGLVRVPVVEHNGMIFGVVPSNDAKGNGSG